MSLFSRNNNMSLVHHVVGQVLDHSGTTDETLGIMNHMGLTVSTSSIHKQKKNIQTYHEIHIKEMFKVPELGRSHNIEVIGDNVDITRNPSQMSKERRRKSWHWFLLLGIEKRVLFPTLPDSKPKADILSVPNADFIPNELDCKSLEENFIFHIMHILARYVPFFQNFKLCLPSSIPHAHEKETSQKSEYAILDMLDKSENKSDEMIAILEHVHNNYIPQTGTPPSVVKKLVFGGDCLTNERAYSSQTAMLAHSTDSDRLAGVIHRPEGLHRMMNLCLVFLELSLKFDLWFSL
ncbi:uncharacterized protein LOC126820675 [Patella vulgata]|uniref:uncharacterized protein LOC126820675 n=1 Tax=Patella vulgata TaxID=6465 RepID=UPI00217FC872|nr:uncharacterized protein LOC126820675 [Patella vulgata]